jgi:hypothetical protein
MANYLYYIGGADQRPNQDGTITGTYEFSAYDVAGVSGVNPSNNLVINAAGTPENGSFTGDAYGGGGFSGTYNNADNWTKWMNASGWQAPSQWAVIGCVDKDLAGTLDIAGQVNGFNDRNGTLQDGVSHQGSMTSGVYTVIVPGSVTKFGSQRDGTVLVWYIANGNLGPGANAIGLPMRTASYPVDGDTDLEAAAKILYFGMGVLKNSGGTDMREYAWAPQG